MLIASPLDSLDVLSRLLWGGQEEEEEEARSNGEEFGVREKREKGRRRGEKEGERALR